MRAVAMLCWIAAACGRIGFDARGGDDVVDGDGGIDGDTHVDGCRLGPETIIATGTTDAWEAQLLWTGSRLAITWSEAMGEFEIMLALADADGVLATPARNISNATEHSWFSSLAWSGAELGVAWSDDRTGNNDIRFARVDPTTGMRIGADIAVTAAAGDGWFPTIAFTPNGYEIAWADDAVDNFEVWRARVTASGTIAVAPTRTTTTAVSSWAPAINYTGTHVFEAWGEEGNISDIFATIGDGTIAAGPLPLVTSSGVASLPALAWTGSQMAMAWQDTRDGMAQIYVALFDLDGNRIGNEHRITIAGPAADPAIAWSGTGFGVAWEDMRTGSQQIYFAELDATGARIGPEVAVTTTGASDNAAIAWTGAHYVLAYDGVRARVDEDVYTRTVCIP